MRSTSSPFGGRHRRRVIAAVAVALAGAGVAAAVPAAPVSAAPAPAAPVPMAIPGDPRSPAVAMLAQAALSARDALVVAADAETLHAYEVRLEAAAAGVAVEFATDAAAVSDAWARADLDGQTAMLAALTQLGVDYQYASSEPGVGFDCSGLTSFAWRHVGVELPPQSGSQIEVSPAVDPAAAAAGDLVQYPGHVMLYLGFDSAVVHAANEASDVELATTGSRSLSWADPNG